MKFLSDQNCHILAFQIEIITSLLSSTDIRDRENNHTKQKPPARG